MTDLKILSAAIIADIARSKNERNAALTALWAQADENRILDLYEARRAEDEAEGYREYWERTHGERERAWDRALSLTPHEVLVSLGTEDDD